MKIAFIGHGYVGLVTASIFADLGNDVFVVGHTPDKVEGLKKGFLPIYEPGLEEIVKRNLAANRLHFTLDFKEAIPQSEVVFIAVGTPPKPVTGEADLTVVKQVAEEIGKNLDGYTVVVTKSTVPVGTHKELEAVINKVKPEKAEFDMASTPEFLREGQAISDTLNPDRVVIGTYSDKARNILVELHKPIGGKRVLTNIPTAELIKYAANSFLATKISYANAIAHLAEKLGADGLQVLEGISLDKRIGGYFLSPGAGYGGSCFPKDVKALIHIAKGEDYDFTLLKSAEEVNKQTILNIVKKTKSLVGELEGKTVGILGLSFKPDTDDMRDAPSIIIINELLNHGASVKAFDPIAMEKARKILPNIVYTNNAIEAATDVDVLIIVTDWNEFKQLDLRELKSVMKEPNLVDGRNIYEPEKAKELGFNYVGVGR